MPDKQNFSETEKLERELEKKNRQREKKKKPKMKVSGGGVKELGEIIRKRSEK